MTVVMLWWIDATLSLTRVRDARLSMKQRGGLLGWVCRDRENAENGVLIGLGLHTTQRFARKRASELPRLPQTNHLLRTALHCSHSEPADSWKTWPVPACLIQRSPAIPVLAACTLHRRVSPATRPPSSRPNPPAAEPCAGNLKWRTGVATRHARTPKRSADRSDNSSCVWVTHCVVT
jgi:hypothetical protein